MTKLFTSLIIVLCLYTATFAQTKSNVEFGANIGYNISYVNVTGITDVNSPGTSGVNLGISAKIPLSGIWSIKGKVIFDQKGWSDGFLSNADGTVINNINFQLNYITIPIMVNWEFGKKKNWYLNFGPYAGFLLGATETSTSTDVKSDFNSNDFGLSYGLGVKIPVSNRLKLFFEYNGQSGISNIIKGTPNSIVVQNFRSAINVGINFPLR
jgi:opacity protein-like surface antigen